MKPNGAYSRPTISATLFCVPVFLYAERLRRAVVGPEAVAIEVHAATQAPIGLLAGSGRFPILFAEAARRQESAGGLRRRPVRGERGVAPRSARNFEYVGISKLGRMIRDVPEAWASSEIVMAGKVTKSVMHTPMRILKLMPDYRMMRMWYRALVRQT